MLVDYVYSAFSVKPNAMQNNILVYKIPYRARLAWPSARAS